MARTEPEAALGKNRRPGVQKALKDIWMKRRGLIRQEPRTSTQDIKVQEYIQDISLVLQALRRVSIRNLPSPEVFTRHTIMQRIDA